jgi:hypothetical protein
MKLIIEIEMENAAFEDGRWDEVSRILRTAQRKVERAVGYNPEAGQFDANLLDINGNTVGSVKLR